MNIFKATVLIGALLGMTACVTNVGSQQEAKETQKNRKMQKSEKSEDAARHDAQCADLREDWKNITDFDREATRQGTRRFGWGQIDVRKNDVKREAREKHCKL